MSLLAAPRAEWPICNLQHEPALPGELQELPIRFAVTADPDEAFGVDIDAVLTGDPVVALPRPAPDLHDVALRVELNHRRRGHAALGPRRRESRSALVRCQETGPLDDLDMVLRVDGHAGNLAEYLAVRERLGPEWVNLRRRGIGGPSGSASQRREEHEHGRQSPEVC